MNGSVVQKAAVIETMTRESRLETMINGSALLRSFAADVVSRKPKTLVAEVGDGTSREVGAAVPTSCLEIAVVCVLLCGARVDEECYRTLWCRP